jgi:hypothetical protein
MRRLPLQKYYPAGHFDFEEIIPFFIKSLKKQNGNNDSACPFTITQELLSRGRK